MAGPWLFTISRGAGISFNLTDGPIPVTAEDFWKLVEDGRIDQDRYWGGKSGIKAHWNDVEIGDELFIYTGNKPQKGGDDLGIIGYATISDKEELSNGRWLIPKFDRDRCLMLRDHPIPATVVRKWRRNLRPNVIDLGPFQNTLNALLPWGRSLHPPKPAVQVAKGRGNKGR